MMTRNRAPFLFAQCKQKQETKVRLDGEVTMQFAVSLVNIDELIVLTWFICS